MGDIYSRRLAHRLMAAAGAMVFVLAGPAMASTSLVPARSADTPPHYVQLAGLFGESDEEIAAKQREKAQDASIASLLQRVSDLEQSLRQLTGQVQDAEHRNAVLQQKIDRMQKDFDYRLCQIAAQQLGASGDNSGQPGLDCTSSGAQSPSPQPSGGAQQSGAAASPASPRGQPSGVLGTLPAGTPLPTPHQSVSVNMSAVGAAPPSAQPAPAGTATHKEFNAAMTLLAKAQYHQARAAFRGFADAHPKDDLAPQAVYWVGSIAYVQQDYSGAAQAFAEEIKEYPDSPRAPESMLKLGQSLIAMKQKEEGCTTLGALSSKYPKASRTIKREAYKARREAHCH